MSEFVQHGLVYADGRVEAVDGARAVVEQVGNRIVLLLAVHRKVRALGQVLAAQAVGVRAGAALPGAVRVTEVHHYACVGSQIVMARHLLALVVGQGLAHRLDDVAQPGREALQRRGRRRIGQLDQHHQARAAFDQYAHRRTVAFVLDEFALKVAVEGVVTGLGRAHMDAQQIGYLASAPFSPAARHAISFGTAQTGDQLFAQLTLGHGIDAGVDALVRDSTLGFVGPQAFEYPRDLRGRPPPGQKVLNHAEEQMSVASLDYLRRLKRSHRARRTAAEDVVLDWSDSYQRRSIRPVGKACQFTCDRRGRPVQRAGLVARRAVAGLHHHDRCSLFRGEFFVVASHRATYRLGVALDFCFRREIHHEAQNQRYRIAHFPVHLQINTPTK